MSTFHKGLGYYEHRNLSFLFIKFVSVLFIACFGGCFIRTSFGKVVLGGECQALWVLRPL